MNKRIFQCPIGYFISFIILFSPCLAFAQSYTETMNIKAKIISVSGVKANGKNTYCLKDTDYIGFEEDWGYLTVTYSQVGKISGIITIEFVDEAYSFTTTTYPIYNLADERFNGNLLAIPWLNSEAWSDRNGEGIDTFLGYWINHTTPSLVATYKESRTTYNSSGPDAHCNIVYSVTGGSGPVRFVSGDDEDERSPVEAATDNFNNIVNTVEESKNVSIQSRVVTEPFTNKKLVVQGNELNPILIDDICESGGIAFNVDLPNSDIISLPYYINNEENVLDLEITFQGSTLQAVSGFPLMAREVGYLTLDVSEYKSLSGTLALSMDCSSGQSIMFISDVSTLTNKYNDYDGDGAADIAVRRPSTGTQFIKRSSDDVIHRLFFGSQPTDVPVSGDFDGDGISDIAVFRPNEGRWFIKLSKSGDIQRFVFGSHAGDLPVPADYDGDGITDIAIRRPTAGQWIIRQSSDPSSYLRVTFGTQEGDIPVPADYDNDGRADIAVRRPSSGQWIYQQSSDNAIMRFYFGAQTDDIPVPSDYDGDGKIDFAIRRPSTGSWFVRRSSDKQISRTFFGSLAEDIPVPSDYDGDGVTDFAFRRPSTSQTIYALSSDNDRIYRVYFGSESSDIPLASPLMTRLNMAGFYSSDSSNVASNDSALEGERWEIDSYEHYHEMQTERLEFEVINDSEFNSKPERVLRWPEKVNVEKFKQQ